MSLTITPLTDAIGAEVTHINLAQPITPKMRDDLEAALVDHLVLVVRDQNLSPMELLDAVRLFGPIKPQHLTSLLMPEYPEIAVLDSRKTKVGADGRFVAIGARDWHTDHAHQDRPPNYTALYAVKLPSRGGDTSFANMQRAYAALPSETRAQLDKLTVITKIDDRYSTAQDQDAHAAARSHPLIRTHPVTGRKGIFFHPGMVAHLEGLGPEESHAFLESLLARVIAPEITYRHKWRPRDLVIMDNRGQMHVGHQDYDLSVGRILHRVLVEGAVPY